jgi:hypothetical protein
VSRAFRRGTALGAVVLIVALAGAGVAGCGGDDDEPAAATATTTTEAQTTQATQPSGDGREGEVAPEEADPTPADTGPTVPETGGVGVDEQDTEENDIPPPPGSPAEEFEQQCEQNPEICD